MSTVPLFYGGNGTPGMGAAVETFENEFMFGSPTDRYYEPAIVLGTSSDAGNTDDTAMLRKGLLMSKNRVTQKWSPWTPYTPEGLFQVIDGILAYTLSMNDGLDKHVGMLVHGKVKSDRLIVAGQTDSIGLANSDYRYLVARQLPKGILLENEFYELRNNVVYQGTTNFNFGIYPNGTHVIHDGEAAVATLPAPLPGLQYSITAFGANDVVVTAATAGDIIGPGDAALDTATLSDIGDSLHLMGVEISAGVYKWIAYNHTPVAASVSVAFA